MPSRRSSPAAMPAGADAAYQAIGSTARLETLRHLMSNPVSTRSELMASTGLSLTAARSSLLELERLGYVRADPPGDRSGRRVKYHTNREAVTADLALLLAWIVS